MAIYVHGSFAVDGAVLVTHYVARHNGLEVVRSRDLGEALAFVRAHLRRLVAAPPAGSRLLTIVGEHVIYVRAIGPDGGRLTTQVVVSACFRRLERPAGSVLPPASGK
jgi:hypothetical protein